MALPLPCRLAPLGPTVRFAPVPPLNVPRVAVAGKGTPFFITTNFYLMSMTMRSEVETAGIEKRIIPPSKVHSFSSLPLTMTSEAFPSF